jgi:hypothetical protein
LRNAIKKLPPHLNVQQVLQQLFKEFKGQTLRVGKLASACLKVGIDHRQILGSVVTRWLSLLRPLENLINMFPAVVEYYKLKEVPKGPIDKKVEFMKTFFADPSSLVWLKMVKDMAAPFHKTVLEIEGDHTTILSCIHHIRTLIGGCQISSRTPVFRRHIKQLLDELDPNKKSELEEQFKELNSFTHTYLHSWCEHLFVFERFSWALILESPGSLSEISDCINYLQEKGIEFKNEETLAFEYARVKTFIEQNLAGWKKRNLKTVQRWVELFTWHHQRSIELPTFELLISFIFSISASNAVVERVFSFINRFWSDNKSNMHFSTMVATVMTKFCLIPFSDSTKDCDNADAIWDRIQSDPGLYKRIKTSGKYKSHFTV